MKLICTILAAVVLLGPATAVKADDKPFNAIRVVVHDSVVTQLEIEDQLRRANDELKRDYARQPQVLDQKLNEAGRDIVEHLLERQLILHEFKVASLSIPEKYIDDEVQRRVRAYGERMVLIKSLEAQGTTFDKYRLRLREQIIEGLMRRHTVSPEKIIISPHRIETYYQEHLEGFKLADRVKLRMIAVNKPTDGGDALEPRHRAEEALAKLNVGGNFAEVARQYSQGAQRSEGGLFGWADRTALRKDLADHAFALKSGERSGIIEAPDAFYIMLVEELQLAHYTPLSEVHDQIERDLADSERSRLEHQWIDKLKKKTFWRYF